MKINHIGLNSFFSWSIYWDINNKESTSDIYELRIYRNIEYSYYGCRYQLVSYENKRYYSRNILTTDSKEEMKIILDLMGLRAKKVDIFVQEKSNEDTIIPCSTIYLKV